VPVCRLLTGAFTIGRDAMTTFSQALADLGLRENPFAPTADPQYFYATREHKAALFRLWSHIDERLGIAVLFGESGAGKTTLMRKLIGGMSREPERYNLAIIGAPLPSWNTGSLLDAILAQFGIKSDETSIDARLDALNRYLIEHQDRIATLIIDDAQNLNRRGQLEILRLAQNLETAQHKLLNIVCFADPQWTRVLAAAPGFRQRINVACTVQGLIPAEIPAMIEFRLRQAGWNEAIDKIFARDAIEAVQRLAEGLPRRVVTLCRNALMLAVQTGTRRVTRDIVEHTAARTLLQPTPVRRHDRKPVEPAAPRHPVALRNEEPKPELEPMRVAVNENAPRESRGPVIVPMQRRRMRAFESQANRMLAAVRERPGA
jgi:general secretion pathway protein A